VTDDVNKEESIIIADKKTNTRLAFSLTYRLSWSMVIQKHIHKIKGVFW